MKPPQLGAFIVVYFTEQSEMQDICKLSEESDAEKEKCHSGKIYFSSFSLGFHMILFFQSEIKSWEFIWWQQQVGKVGQWTFQWNCKSSIQASNQSLSSTIDRFFSEKLWIPDFGESVFPFEHLNLRNRVRVIFLQHQLPRKLKIQRRTFIHNSFLLNKQNILIWSPKPRVLSPK